MGTSVASLIMRLVRMGRQLAAPARAGFGEDAESGRGLHVIAKLAELFSISPARCTGCWNTRPGQAL